MSQAKSEREYGGFLPLELNPGKEYFSAYEDRLGRFNSVKAALAWLLEQLEVEKLYIPYYYCPSTTEALRACVKELVFYHIDERLLPDELPDEAGSAVLLVDYFGVRSEEISALARSFREAEVILDRAHAFFAEPVRADRIHNVYSAKKFFGIPDGAYLIPALRQKDSREASKAYPYADYLLRSFEEGCNAAYSMKKEADHSLAENYGPMSALARGLMRNADTERVNRKRCINYACLYEALQGLNALRLPEEAAAYQFPLLLKGEGDRVKKALVKEKIFVSTLWNGKELAESGNAFELSMRDHCVFLPIDQRYDTGDMEYIAERVRDLYNDHT